MHYSVHLGLFCSLFGQQFKQRSRWNSNNPSRSIVGESTEFLCGSSQLLIRSPPWAAMFSRYPAPCDRRGIWPANRPSKRPEGVPHCPQPARQPANQQTRHKQPQPRRTTLQAGGGAHPRPDEGRRNRPSRRSREQGQHHQQGRRASPHAPRENQDQGEQPHKEQHQARGARRRQPEPDTPRRQQANQQGEQAHHHHQERRQANQATSHHHRPRDAHAQRQREHHSHGGEPTTDGRNTLTGSAGWRTEFMRAPAGGAQTREPGIKGIADRQQEASTACDRRWSAELRSGAVRPTRASVGAARAASALSAENHQDARDEAPHTPARRSAADAHDRRGGRAPWIQGEDLESAARLAAPGGKLSAAVGGADGEQGRVIPPYSPLFLPYSWPL